MNSLQLMVFLFFVTSCFASVKRSTTIVLDQTIAYTLDSLSIIDSLQEVPFQNGIKINSNQRKYNLQPFKKGMRIALKFKDGRNFIADKKVISVDNQKVIIKMRYNKPILHQYTQFELVYPIMIVTLIILLIVKLPIAYSVLKPDSLQTFLLRYCLLVLSGIGILTIQFTLRIFSLPLFFLQIFLFPVLIDYFFLWFFYRHYKKGSLILTSLFSNFAFNTIGLFLIYYITAKLDFY